MASESYAHTQIGTMIIGVVGVCGLLTAVALFAGEMVSVAVITGVIALLVVALFGSLTININKDAFAFHFGVGLIRKRIPLFEVRTWRTVSNQWMYGWGIRLYPGGWLYNVSGLSAVELHLKNGKKLRVGTDEPEAVCKALESILGTPEPLSEQERAQAKSRTVMFVVIAVAIMVLICGGLGILFWAQMQPVEVSVGATSFRVDEPLYDVEVPWADVQSITLVDRLPQVELRTNGFALGGTLRGHFRVKDLGTGRLYVDGDYSPTIQIVTKGDDDKFVMLNFEDPAQTRALHAELLKAWKESQK